MSALRSLFDAYSDADDLMRRQPEDVAPTLLRLAMARGKGTFFKPETLTRVSPAEESAGRYYPNEKRLSVDRFLGRVFRCIEDRGLWEPVPGANGYNGWRIMTETGETIARDQAITSLLDTPPVEQWITAADARRLLEPAFKSGYLAAKTICTRAHNGLIRSRAERYMVGNNHTHSDMELPTEFWWAEGEAALTQNWITGDFETWLRHEIHLRAFGVSFLRGDIERLIPPNATESAAAATSSAKDTPAKGGRPKADWWEDLWVEVCRQLYVGDAKPKTQADIERAMLQWIDDNGHSAGETTVRERASKLWRAIKDEN